jgi:hypothetical protein
MKLARIFFRKAVKGWKKVSAKKVQKFVEIQEEKKKIVTPQSLSITPSLTIPLRVLTKEERRNEEKIEKEKLKIEGILIPRQLKVIPSPPSLQQPEEISINTKRP